MVDICRAVQPKIVSLFVTNEEKNLRAKKQYIDIVSRSISQPQNCTECDMVTRCLHRTFLVEETREMNTILL